MMERGTTIFKKASPNGEIVIYLRSREFASIEEPVDGGVAVSAKYLRGRKIFAQLVILYRFGLEKDEIMGLKFSREFILASQQLYPSSEEKGELTHTQILLKKKVSRESRLLYPFKFYFPDTAPSTVSLFPRDNIDPGQACGVRYYVNIFVAHSEDDPVHKRNKMQVNIRRIQYAPREPALHSGPQTLERKTFLACSGYVELEATLDKLIFERNEEIMVNMSVQNYSNKKVKKIKVSLFQKVSIQMLQRCHYQRIIDESVTKKACPIQPGSSLHMIVSVIPRLPRHRIEEGTALDGSRRFVDSELAASTYLHSYPVKEAFGIVVNYFIRIKIYVGSLHSPIVAELPVVIMPSRISSEIVPIEV